MREATSRRRFLKLLAGLGTLAAWGPVLKQSFLSPAEAAEAASYRISPWTGDSFFRGHRLRDGDLPSFPRQAEKTVDFVIVGGGIAGLTAAYYLRNDNFLLLEQYDQLGGQARGGSYRGIGYSWGPVSVSSIEDATGKLFDELALQPLKLPPQRNSWYWQGEWLPGVEGADQLSLYRQFDRLAEEMRPLWRRLPGGEIPVPLEDPYLERLDSIFFSSYLTGYDEQFVSLMDSLLKSAYCGGVDQISALAGAALAQELFNPCYAFKGGNSAICRALRSSIWASGPDRCHTGTFVWNVELADGGASVVYGTRMGTMHRVDCRKVIMAIPPIVAARVVPQLSDIAKAVLLWFKFGSYLVANFCMPKKVFNGAFDNWVGSPFSFADAILAESLYEATGSYRADMGSVLTVYQPYAPASSGRSLLLDGNRQELARSLVTELLRLVDQFDSNLEEVVLTRWGHAMVVPCPGLFARISRLRSTDNDPVILAYSGTEGLPCTEAAIAAGRRAALACLGKAG